MTNKMVLNDTSTCQPDRESGAQGVRRNQNGVKGLVDAGITKVREYFIYFTRKPQLQQPELTLPTIDLQGIDNNPIQRKEVIEQVKGALESWGFFQMVNHGIPINILEEMIR
ncbi:putative non-heme dioxygenase domain, isopenicillin N synthase [Helianthus annuus]|nr:putative non-heme dioxygenase domain, isopenicillin N synthase [Helianthus annuus]